MRKKNATTLCLLASLAMWWGWFDLVAGDGAELLDQARASHIAGDLERALALYEQAREELIQAGDEAGAATCLNNASVILLGQGKPALALEHAQEAVKLRRMLDDPRRTGRSLTNAGRALRELGRYVEAEQALGEALALARQVDDPRDQVVNLVNLGVLAQMEGRYGDALDAAGDGLVLVDSNGGESWAPRQRLVLLNNRAALYERIGEFQLALTDLRAILELVGDGAASVPYRVNGAVLLRNLGDPNLAIEELRDAERVLLASDGPSAALHANLLSNIALALHRNLGRLDESAAVLEQALALVRQAADRHEAAMIGNALARVYFDQGRVEEARAILLEILLPASGDVALEGAWEAHLEMGRLALALEDRDGAVRALLTAVALIEGSRRDLQPRFVARRFLADRVAAYALLADTLAAGGQQAELRRAMEVVQRARERLFLPAAPEGLVLQDHGDELQRLSAAAARSYRDPGATAEWQQLERDWSSRSPIRLPEEVPAGEAWIAFLFGGDGGRMFWMASDGLGSRPLPPEGEIANLTAAWLAALSSGDDGEPRLGQALAGVLLGEVIAQLPRATAVLRIVPDGPLWNVPLDALPPSAQSQERLLRSYDIVVVPALPHQVNEPPAPIGTLRSAFFGPPAALPSGLAPLPEAEEEADALRRASGPVEHVFLGAEATEGNLRATLARGTGILHIATHAVVDTLDPGRTGIVLQPEEGGARAGDGFFSLAELDGRAAVRLTFLSACSGARGEPMAGEGVESLAARLLEAGSDAVVASLWDVDDAATRAFVEQFYHQLGRGRSSAAAVREAKRRLARSQGDLASPRHWAPWVALGHGALQAPLIRPRPGLRAYLLGAALIAVVAVFLVRRLVARRHAEPPGLAP